MKIGLPKEIKDNERRVALVVDNVRALCQGGHEVIVETQAGLGVGISDQRYQSAGAQIVPDNAALYEAAELIVKVKEPLAEDLAHLRKEHILFTFLHLAAAQEIANTLLAKELTAIAYETVQLPDRSLPLLLPMSEIAGRMSILLAANSLRSDKEGMGLLISGLPGVAPGRVVILGGGTVGINAAKVAIGLGARVTLLHIDLSRLSYLDDLFNGRVTTLMSNQTNLERSIQNTDVLIGGVLIAGAAAPKLVNKEMVASMHKGSVIVDVAVDQGGCVETCRPTSISDPTYVLDGVIHCCISNIPATVSKTSTYALTNATFPYVKKLADLGLQEAMKASPALAAGLNTYRGACSHKEVAAAIKVPYEPPQL